MKPWIRIGLLMVLLSLPVCAAVDTNVVARAMEALLADIERDTAALILLRDEIETARGPLARELSGLQAEAAALRAEESRLQRLRQQGEQDQARLRERAHAAREAYEFAETLLTEYARSLDTRVGVAEAAALVADLQPIRDQLAAADAPTFAALAEQLLAGAQHWSLARVGGRVHSGVALDNAGMVHEGRFATFGPVAFFVAAETDTAGLAITRPGRLEPGIHPLDREGRMVLRQLLDGERVRVPADVTLGDAIRMEQSRMNLLERLGKGGFVMVPLLLTGFVAFVLAVWKAFSLLRLRNAVHVDIGEIAVLLQQGALDRANALVAGIKVPLADIIREAIVHREAPREHLEEILHEHVVNVLPQAERHLGTLAVLGGVAPLLGLLGTVTGMIHTFQLVTLFGSGDARMLSGGISEALITTETGLIIAVPVLLVQAFLARGAKSVVARLERQALILVNHLHARGGAA